MTRLTVHHANLGYARRPVLRDVSFTVPAGCGTSHVLDRAAANDPGWYASDRTDALQKPVAEHRAWDAGLDNGLRFRAIIERYSFRSYTCYSL